MRAPESLDDIADAWFVDKEDVANNDAGTSQRATLREILLDIYGPIEGEPMPKELRALRD